MVELSWTGFVCRLRGVSPPCIQGQVIVLWRFAWFTDRFRCLFLRWISLVRFAESRCYGDTSNILILNCIKIIDTYNTS